MSERVFSNSASMFLSGPTSCVRLRSCCVNACSRACRPEMLDPGHSRYTRNTASITARMASTVKSLNVKFVQGRRAWAPSVLDRLGLEFCVPELFGAFHLLYQRVQVLSAIASDGHFQFELIVRRQLGSHGDHIYAARHDLLQIVEELCPGKASSLDLPVPVVILVHDDAVFRLVFHLHRLIALLLQVVDPLFQF